MPKELKSRKKIKIYDSLDIRKKYCSVFILEAKSRFLSKNAQELILLCADLISYKDHNYKYKYLIISSPICSKAEQLLKDNGWKIFKGSI